MVPVGHRDIGVAPGIATIRASSFRVGHSPEMQEPTRWGSVKKSSDQSRLADVAFSPIWKGETGSDEAALSDVCGTPTAATDRRGVAIRRAMSSEADLLPKGIERLAAVAVAARVGTEAVLDVALWLEPVRYA